MNIRGGIALIRKSLFSYLASRGFFWTLAVSWMMGPAVFLFVWMAAAGEGSLQGIGRSDFITYYIAIIMINQLTYPTSHWIIGENIQIGTLSAWLLRPLPVVYEAIASDMALRIVCMPLVLLLTLILSVFLGFGSSLTLQNVLLFIPAIIMAAVLRFFTSYTVALLALWTNKIDSLLSINDTLVFLLSGQVAPTILLPGPMRDISVLLPFRYMLGFPAEVLAGMQPYTEILKGLLIQSMWMICAVAVQRVVFRSGIKRYTAIGG